MIHYLPIEAEPMRYTESLDRHITEYLREFDLPFRKIDPALGVEFKRELPAGQFLDAPRTIAYKSLQIAELARSYATGELADGDIVFLSDLWCPGIEAVRYLDFFCKKKVRLRGILHAGSFTDTDFVRRLERWAAMFENTLFDIFDRVYVASEFIKREVCERRLLDPARVSVTPFPLDARAVCSDKPRQNAVVFNGRLCDEKQPWLFDALRKRVRAPEGTLWINTQECRFSQESYYGVLQSSKVVVSFALQENFGFGVAEAVMAGCIPVLPNRLVYPEFYPDIQLYDSFEECVELVEEALRQEGTAYQAAIRKYVSSRIRPNIGAWFA